MYLTAGVGVRRAAIADPACPLSAIHLGVNHLYKTSICLHDSAKTCHTFAGALNALRVLLLWTTHALKTGGHMASAVSRSACNGPWVHRVAVVCVTQGLINAVLFAPILMDLFAKPTQGFV